MNLHHLIQGYGHPNKFTSKNVLSCLLTGDLLVNVTYTLTEDNSLDLIFKALTTKPTPVNLANHVYFNLGEEIKYDFFMAHTLNPQ